MLRPELAADADHRERFLREARAAAAINSDHVITIYQISESMPPYFAMQFLEGESLETRLEGTERITLRSALEIARQTAEGLAAAHERGLTHRDIKPANLWLEAKPVVGKPDAGKPGILRPQTTMTRVRILDFGLARRSADPSLTSTGFVVGTPHFMSPEQASGLPVDGRSDLFALGCVMYTMLTGELPFPGKTTMAVMTALATKTPQPVHEKNPSVPRSVSDLIARMLEKDPSARTQSARQIVDVLEEVLSDLSGTTTLPTPRAATMVVTQAVGETPLVGETERVAVSTEAIAPPVPRRRLPWAVWAGLAVLLGLVAFLSYRELRNAFTPGPEPEPIVVGILHSQSGTMAVSEAPVVDATLLAIEEINAAGGVLGRRLKAVIVDGKSNADVFAAAPRDCWMRRRPSSSSDAGPAPAARPSATCFNGARMDCSSTRFSTRASNGRRESSTSAPRRTNSSSRPWITSLDRSPRAGSARSDSIIVGSDYVFPRAAHEIIKDQVRLKKDVELVGETFIPFGSPGVNDAVNRIKALKADAIINTINGSTNVAFFRELRKAGVIAAEVPTLSVSITENEVSGLNPVGLAGITSPRVTSSRSIARKAGSSSANSASAFPTGSGLMRPRRPTAECTSGRRPSPGPAQLTRARCTRPVADWSSRDPVRGSRSTPRISTPGCRCGSVASARTGRSISSPVRVPNDRSLPFSSHRRGVKPSGDSSSTA